MRRISSYLMDKEESLAVVGYAAGAAFGIGLCLGWFTSRVRTRYDH